MKMVYTHQNLILVENVKNVLNHEGLESIVKNAGLSSGFGELSGIDTWPEVWLLHPQQYVKAQAIVAELVGEGPLSKDESLQTQTPPTWVCMHCSESNPKSFDSCWNCQVDA